MFFFSMVLKTTYNLLQKDTHTRQKIIADNRLAAYIALLLV